MENFEEISTGLKKKIAYKNDIVLPCTILKVQKYTANIKGKWKIQTHNAGDENVQCLPGLYLHTYTYIHACVGVCVCKE